MSAGLFGLICPQCNGELGNRSPGMGICAGVPGPIATGLDT